MINGYMTCAKHNTVKIIRPLFILREHNKYRLLILLVRILKQLHRLGNCT